VQKVVTGWSLDVQYVSLKDPIVKKVRAETGQRLWSITGSRHPLDRDPVVVEAGSVGKTVAADEGFGGSLHLNLKSQILARFEAGQIFFVLGTEVK
jgi:hypothetical protein